MIIFSFVALLSCQYATDFRITANQNNFVTKGDVKFENNQLSLSEKWWEVDETINGIATDAQPVDNAEADIVNCAGYLASAKILKKTETVWQAILISETVAKDAEEKIRLCDESLESSYITGTAFAVTPRKEGRKNIKLEKPDLQKVFASLSRSNQSWANCSQISDDNNCVRKEKNILSRFAGDDWADIDGNGEIDLILLKGNCNRSGDYTCTKTLLWNGWNWMEIAYSKPA